MTRLCGLNPNIDYTPIKWALCDPRGVVLDVPPRVRGTVEAETTATAYEALSEEDRAILLLLHAECFYAFPQRVWTIRIDLHGARLEFCFQDGRNYTLRGFIGYILDHGYCPEIIEHPFRWREP